jgi:hypothetical protein
LATERSIGHDLGHGLLVVQNKPTPLPQASQLKKLNKSHFAVMVDASGEKLVTKVVDELKKITEKTTKPNKEE